MRVNWDNIGATWMFDYRANIITKPYSGKVVITNPHTEPTITGTLNPMVLTCADDVTRLNNWFSTGSMLIRCPVFYRDGDVLDKSGNIIVKCKADVASQSVKFATMADYTALGNRYYYSYSNIWFTGEGSDNGILVSNTSQAIWKLKICPKERGYQYHQAGSGKPMRVDAIDFLVLPRTAETSFFT